MKKITIYVNENHDQTFYSRLKYTIDCINDHPITKKHLIYFEFSFEQGDISYEIDRKNDLSIPQQKALFIDEQQYFVNSYDTSVGDVFSVEREAKGRQPFFQNNTFAFDIFETIFFHLSRYEERLIKQGDFLGNKIEFENQLLLVKNKIEKIPVVDDLIKAFLEVLLKKDISVSKPVFLTHDIDFIQKFESPLSIFRKFAGHIRHKKPLSTFPILWRTYMDYLVNGQDSFDTFDWMLSKKNIDKSIYFLVGGSHKEDNQYDLKNPIIKKAIKLAKERNYRIGIHPSYESWNNLSLIKAQKEKLENEVGEEIVISRQHFLNFDIEITPKLLQDAGINEDSSLGYTRYVGYRCGTGFPYLLYDFENEKAFDVVEKPLVFMDSSWFFEAKRQGNWELDFNSFYGGFNFHNSFFSELELQKKNIRDEYLEVFR